MPESGASLVALAAAAIRARAEHLTALDQAIGDGDHGLNMRRGFDALLEQQAELAALPLGQALQKAGMTLVMKVGGASGPLYGSLLMACGKAAPALELGRPPDGAALRRMLQAGIAAVMARGKSTAGEKTLLDVLVPVEAALAEGLAAGEDLPALARRARLAADAAAEATKPLRATKGRASFLGSRSVGHMDPGACSSALLIATLCDFLTGTP
jgi:dihydroxyacetone kinase-like protein